MSLDTILTSIAAGLATLEPALKISEVVGGQLDFAEMRRRSVRFPGAFLACAALDDVQKFDGIVRCTGRFVVVLAVDGRREDQLEAQDRARASARLAGRVVFALAGKAGVWGDDEVQAAPERVQARNLYSKTADSNNTALWAVTWEQLLVLKQDPPAGELDDFLELAADYQLVEDGEPTNPEIDAQDVIKPNG